MIQTKLRLTGEQMEAIHAVIDGSNNPVIPALEATFNFLLAREGKSWASFSADDKLDVSAYAIPESQWHQISEWLLVRGRTLTSGITAVNWGLDWMNYGPSSYKHLTDAQERTLRNLCERYHVEFDEDHYSVYTADSIIMPGWAEGWVGGPTHANPQYAEPAEPRGAPTIYVGVSPEGDSHS